MTLKKTSLVTLVAITGATFTISASADSGQYFTVSYGLADLDDSANSGNFPGGFTTGAGTTVPAGTALGAGTSVGWNTVFDEGDAFSIAWGREFGSNLRFEIELSAQDNDVETHSGVTVADTLNIDTEDAGVLITGSANIGASVGAVVSAGRGSIDTNYLMINGYYDFPTGSAITPYLGAGIGYADADITFNPSGIDIVDDSDSTFAYQLTAGAEFAVSDSFDLFGQLRYRATDEFEVSTLLFPASLEIENESTNFEVGLRYKF